MHKYTLWETILKCYCNLKNIIAQGLELYSGSSRLKPGDPCNKVLTFHACILSTGIVVIITAAYRTHRKTGRPFK